MPRDPGHASGPDHRAVSFTGPTLPLQRRKGVRVNPQPHTLIAAVVGSSLASGERRGRGAGRGETCLLWTVSAGERGNAASTATAAAAVPGVVLCVADGIVRIAAGIIRAAARLSGGIDRLIGVAAGEDKRCDHDRDAEPHGRFATHWSRPVGRSFGRCAEEVCHHALRRQRWRSH